MSTAFRLIVLLCGAAILLAACETAPVTGRSQIMLVSEDEDSGKATIVFYDDVEGIERKSTVDSRRVLR